MVKKYIRNYNSTYSSFLRSYGKAIAEFATKITVEEEESKPKGVRKGVRASLALGGIGAGYALGKNPEAQEVVKNTAANLRDRAGKALELRTEYDFSDDRPSLRNAMNTVRRWFDSGIGE